MFKDQCTACHQDNAQGVEDAFPPLAHNADLFLNRDYPVRVLLFGLSGKIDVNGKSFDSAMPPLDVLSDEQIAAVVNYVRDNFGNAELRPKTMAPLDAAAVAAERKRKMAAEAVFDYRKSLK